MHSYHIFYFPFKWENQEMKHKTFSRQTSLDELKFNEYSNWIRTTEPISAEEADLLYDEKNYYYQFVHPVLYDNKKKDSIIMHFERKETQLNDNVVEYKIATKNKTYTLKVDAINLNLYTTGVGMLSFYLINEHDDQKEAEDILNINQFGRRIFPPFIGDVEIRDLIPLSISIEGLQGNGGQFFEDFTGYRDENHPRDVYKKAWNPSAIICDLITELVSDIIVIPVIDDRMYVNCWYGNDELSKELNDENKCNDFIMRANNNFWYKFLFVDTGDATCQNNNMKKCLLDEQTHARWQKFGSLFGASRYSFVLLSDTSGFSKNVVAKHMRTIFSRMIELVLIQRTSALNFSEEVTRVSRLSKGKKDDKMMISQISDLHREYIRFVNKVYFREVTAQDQGIEIYNLMLKVLNTESYIKDLDNEIEELHHYLSSLDDRVRNKNSEKLNLIAAFFIPATLASGLFGMNYGEGAIITDFWRQFGVVVVSTVIMFGILQLINKKK